MHIARLRIENLALVDMLDVELPAGLIAVTGETGAGKSMVLGSLQLILGQRADLSLVRDEDSKGLVEALFELGGTNGPAERALHTALETHGLALEDGEMLILRRELSGGGRSTAAAAGRFVSARQLAEVADHLIDIHSQHDQQSLVQRRWQREALDAFAGAEKDAAAVHAAHARWQQACREHEEWLTQERELRRREDLLQFQLNEIDGAALVGGEEEELLLQEALLANAEEIGESIAELLSRLDDEEQGVLAQLQHAQRVFGRLRELGVADEELSATLSEAMMRIDELARHFASRRDEVEVNPAELSRVQDRLHLISQLKKKYGDTVVEILAFGEQLRAQLAAIGSYEERVAQLEQEATRACAQLAKCAETLSAKRRAAAPRMARSVAKELAPLGMKDTQFDVHLEPVDPVGAGGAEEVEFRVATNPGEEPQSLSKVASGGELSRIMLALKCVASSRNDVPILVFDEIDAGISGTVAHAVAARLDALAHNHQVFVITHMPQIACRATTQFTVAKRVQSGRTDVTMWRLSPEERETELARMLGGESAAARAHARELLATPGMPTESARQDRNRSRKQATK